MYDNDVFGLPKLFYILNKQDVASDVVGAAWAFGKDFYNLAFDFDFCFFIKIKRLFTVEFLLKIIAQFEFYFLF